MSSALVFENISKCKISRARLSRITLPHHTVDAPVFMPVGTQGTMKGLTPSQLEKLDCQIILSNTYHLGLRPGENILQKANGLHNFMKWKRALLTDSGGFQMVSLSKLSTVSEDGVLFISPRDNKTKMLLTPEKSIELQNSIGADIIMQLDDVVSTLTSGTRVVEAMERTIRWLDRCINAHKNPSTQNLFPIVQGGTNISLRTSCINALVKRNMPGYAIGGLSGGEDKDTFWRVVLHCTKLLPKDRPIYCMGVGYAVDLVVCVALGVDMFDCVYPTRTARFGTAITKNGNISIKNRKYRLDFTPIEKDCSCYTCKNFTRAYLYSIAPKQTVGCHLLTIHNLHFQLSLMERVRESIRIGCFPKFVEEFLYDWYNTSNSDTFPLWVRQACQSVGINL